MVRFITKEGLKKLNEELEDRKTRLRQEIAQAIKEAKEQGDLSENAEYAEAKSQQNENESRIGELEMVIK
ncbi:MAG: Transcription elongation factor GreA, partial [Candidatus Moranbacteria bacterium GW2011_GWE1_36_7]